MEAGAGLGREGAIAAARAAFYQGETGRRIAEWSTEHGGWLTADDVASFEVTVEPAPGVRYDDRTVFAPPGYTQGPVMLLALAILDGLDLPAEGAPRLHLIAEALRLAFWERERALGDGADVAAFLASADRLRGRIDPTRALPDPHGPAPGRARPDTTYLCVVDAAGNAFSAMPSDTLDGGPIVPDLGILVSPRGVQSSLSPGHPNAVAPGKRPRVTPAPAMAVADDGRVTAFGCPGGDVIVQAQLQAFLNLAGGMTHQQAVEAPRIATFSFASSFFPNPRFPMRLDVEARVPAEVRAALAAMGHDLRDWAEWEFDAGGVCMAGDAVPPGEGRVLAAGADPRRTAYAWGR